MSKETERNDFRSGKMNHQDLIRLYEAGSLSEEDKKEYEYLLKTDPNFRKEVEFHQNLKAAISDLKKDQLKTKLKSFEADLKPSRKKSYVVWLVAATVLIIIGVTFSLIFNKPIGSDQLYLAYFEPYENVVAPITRGPSEKTADQQIFMAYENENYEAAAKGFQKLYETTHQSYYLLYTGSAMMANGKPELAIPFLKEQLEFKDNFTEKSRWYLALAYLKTDKIAEAKKLLKEIVDSRTYKAKEAQKILAEIE